MGLHVPQPEVVADETNPKGFGEPRWVVDHHDRLLKEAGVQVSDAPPGGVVRDRPGRHPRARADPHRRLAGEPLRGQPRAGRQGPAAALVPRPVAGGRGPHRRHAGVRDDAAAAARGGRQQADLLRQPARLGPPGRQLAEHDAAHRARHPRVRRRRRPGLRPVRRPARRLGRRRRCTSAETLQLQHVLHADSEQIRDGHRFVDPGPAPDEPDPGGPRPAAAAARAHRATWDELNKLADPGGDTPDVHETLDQLREAYVDLYEESAAISRSSVVAAEQRVKRELKGGGRQAGPAAARGPAGVDGRPDPARRARGHPAAGVAASARRLGERRR